MCFDDSNTSLIKVSPHNRKDRDDIMFEMQAKHNAMLKMLDGWNGKGTKDVKKKKCGHSQ